MCILAQSVTISQERNQQEQRENGAENSWGQTDTDDPFTVAHFSGATINIIVILIFMTLTFIQGQVTLTIYCAYIWASFYDAIISISNHMH